MTTGRKVGLASVAAILAALFVFVQVAHAGGHDAGSAPSDPPCAMCSTAVAAPAEARLGTPVFAPAGAVPDPSNAAEPAPVAGAHRARGPPSRG